MKMDKLIVYLIYAFAITWMVIFTVRAAAATHTSVSTRSEECTICLYRYAACMDFASKFRTKSEAKKVRKACKEDLENCNEYNSCKSK